MEANKILHTSLVDIIFDNRNKLYGAYELRVNYNRRIIKALTISLITITGIIALSSFKKQSRENPPINNKPPVVVEMLPDDKPDEIIPPKASLPPPAERPRTEEFTTIVIAPNEAVEKPVADRETLEHAQISNITNTEGPDDTGLQLSNTITDGITKGIIEERTTPDEIAISVDVPAKFEGDWIRFLTRNLRANVPLENGIAPGQYRVMIQFVVDIDGSVSMIRPLTSLGYGMEEEAVRVLSKAAKWRPALQKGFPVKAYHRQLITFQIDE